MRFKLYRQDSRSEEAVINISDVFCDESVINSIKDAGIKISPYSKVVRAFPEIIIQEETEDETWVPTFYFNISDCPLLNPGVPIFRLQNQEGLGPYSVGKAIHYLVNVRPRERGPSPESDHLPEEALILLDKKVAFCGFISRAQLEKWFDEQDLQELEMLGFKITSVTPKYVFIGANQVVYVP